MQEKNNHISRFSVYSGLVKYKLSAAVAFSASTGYFLCRNTISPGFFSVTAGVFLLAAGSAVLNQYTEREQDAIMPRTMLRPIASKRITLKSAFLVFSILLFSGSCLLLLNGLIPFALGCLGVILYNLLYTSLKKVTIMAIIPGALVGAIPPLIGYTSAGGTALNDKILFFSAFMFLWQIPHFWLLLIRYGKEYHDAGFKTINDFLNEKQIRYLVFSWIFLSTLFLYVYSRLTDLLSSIFSVFLIILNIAFVSLFFRLLFIGKDTRYFRYAFILFNSFSTLIMCLLIADSLLS